MVKEVVNTRTQSLIKKFDIKVKNIDTETMNKMK